MLSDFENKLALSGLNLEVLDAILDIINYNPSICSQFTNAEIEELNEVFPFAPSLSDGKLYHKQCRDQLRQFLGIYPTFRGTSKQKIGRKIYTCFSTNDHLKKEMNPFQSFH